MIRGSVLTAAMLFVACTANAQQWTALEADGDSAAAAGRFADGVTAYTAALPLAEAELGSTDGRIADLLESLGKCYYHLADYTNTEPVWKRALDIRTRTSGMNSIDAAKAMNNLAVLYKAQGRYSESENLFRKTLEIRERLLGAEDPNVATGLNNLANLLLMQARYAEAEGDYQRALEITERSLGQDDPKVAIGLNNLAALYHMLGRYADEEPLYRRCLEIMTKTYGPNHPDLAQALNNLGYMYHDMGKFSDADSLYQLALALQQRSLGAEHPKVAQTLSNLGRLYADEGKYDAAEPYMRQALAIGEKAQGADHPEVAEIIKNLGDLLQVKGQYSEAEAAYQRALAIFNKVGKSHPRAAEALFGLAMVAQHDTQFVKAREYESRAFAIRRKNFGDGFAVMAERNALEYSRFFQEEASNYLSILLDMPEGENVNRVEVARVVLSTKGQVSDGIFMRHKSVSSIAALVDSLNQARQELSRLYVSGPDPQRQWAYATDVSRATEHKERLEADLARRSTEMRDENILTDIDVGKIATKLPAGSALLDFMRYEHRLSLRETESRYVAVLIKSGGRAIVFQLGSAATIDSAVTAYRRHFQDPMMSEMNRERYHEAQDDLYRTVWQRIEPLLFDVKAILVAPDGMLGLVSFAGLLDSKGSYLIEHHAFHYLLSGRDILQPLDLSPRGSGLLALGDPDYDASPAARLGRESNRLLAGVQGVLATFVTRNATSGCRTLREMRLSRIPGTRTEVQTLSREWSHVRSEPVLTYFDSQASEETLKRECRHKRVVHLATHGYYISEECHPDRAAAGFVGESPLLQSGIFLAGANLMGKGAAEAGTDDGIVTAEEVANLYMQGTQLVILSACETGVGKVRSGEGVFGLRRAFQMAGCQTVISALWSVDDESSAAMMGGLFAEGETSVADAMRNAALKRIEDLRKAGRSDDPFFWAGFIATGEWRNH